MLLIPVAHATEPPAQDDLATQLKVLKEQLASQRQLLEQLSRQVQAQRAVAVTDGVAATSAEQLDAQRGAGNVEPQEAADAHVDPDASDLPVVPVARALQDLPTRQASAAVPPRRAVGRTVGVVHLGRDPAPLGDGEALLEGPGTHVSGSRSRHAGDASGDSQ